MPSRHKNAIPQESDDAARVIQRNLRKWHEKRKGHPLSRHKSRTRSATRRVSVHAPLSDATQHFSVPVSSKDRSKKVVINVKNTTQEKDVKEPVSDKTMLYVALSALVVVLLLVVVVVIICTRPSSNSGGKTNYSGKTTGKYVIQKPPPAPPGLPPKVKELCPFFCGKKFFPEVLNEHVKSCTKANCRNCGKNFGVEGLDELIIHEKTCKPAPPPGPKPIPIIYRSCKWCFREINQKELAHHSRFCWSRCKCKYCNKEFPKRRLYRHEQNCSAYTAPEEKETHALQWTLQKLCNEYNDTMAADRSFWERWKGVEYVKAHPNIDLYDLFTSNPDYARAVGEFHLARKACCLLHEMHERQYEIRKRDAFRRKFPTGGNWTRFSASYPKFRRLGINIFNYYEG